MADRPCNSKQEKNSSIWQLKHRAFILTLIPTTRRCVRMRRRMYVPVCVWGKKYLWHYLKCFMGLRWLLIFNLCFFLLCKSTGDPQERKTKISSISQLFLIGLRLNGDICRSFSWEEGHRNHMRRFWRLTRNRNLCLKLCLDAVTLVSKWAQTLFTKSILRNFKKKHRSIYFKVQFS